MYREAGSRFAFNPTDIDIKRSRIERPSSLKTTFNAGDLIPIYLEEVLPGDTFQMDSSFLARMSTPVFPVMDNAWIETFWFFVPNRLVWDHWKEFMGENNSSYWAENIEYSIPQITAPSGGWSRGSLADYMGLPTKVDNITTSSLPFRAYVKIWNEWFRDQNVMEPAQLYTDDSNIAGVELSSITPNVQGKSLEAYRGGYPLPVSKYHDLFTSSLPAPQKGQPVTLGWTNTDVLPVFAGSSPHDTNIGNPIVFNTGSVSPGFIGTIPADGFPYGNVKATSGTFSDYNDYSQVSTDSMSPVNLYASLGSADSVTVNQLREAFAIQRLLETDARFGSRYIEVIKGHFGVTSPDARLQRTEYLGGQRVPINVDQVLQTSSTDSTSPQGNTAAYSRTTSISSDFTKSFTEHGMIIGLACVRTEHSYQQGINRFWSRKRRYDFYWPELANIGEQPVFNKEIFATGTESDDLVFGYQEAWADYRYKPNLVTGAFRSNVDGSLDSWHYADYYDVLPVLSADWIVQSKNEVDRTLAVQSILEDQFIADFFFKCTAVRPMPVYSIPGLGVHF